jgi:glycerophosphoryl diester phosphodiesterase
MGCWRSVVAGLMLLTLAAVPPAANADLSTGYSRDRSWIPHPLTIAPSPVIPGETISFTGRAPVRLAGTYVRLQRRNETRNWVTVQRDKLNAKSRYRFRLPIASAAAAGRRRYRVVSGTARPARRTEVVSEPAPLTVMRQKAQVPEQSWTTQALVSTSFSPLPRRIGQPAHLEFFTDEGNWARVPGTALRVSDNTEVTPTVSSTAWPTWYRLALRSWRGAPAVFSAPWVSRMAKEPFVVAHRGGSGQAPENTLAALRNAESLGADVIDTDVRATSDGELVLMHDATLNRTTNVEELFPDRAPWRVQDFTAAEVATLDAGSHFALQFAGEQVPTLERWISAAGPSVGLEIELKASDELARQRFSAVLSSANGLDAVRAGRVSVTSFDPIWLKRFAADHPDVPVGLIVQSKPDSYQIAQMSSWADSCLVPNPVVDSEFVAMAHSSGLTVESWTPNSVADWRLALTADVDAINTDYPGRLGMELTPPSP